jgi:hypothetical protein
MYTAKHNTRIMPIGESIKPAKKSGVLIWKTK